MTIADSRLASLLLVPALAIAFAGPAASAAEAKQGAKPKIEKTKKDRAGAGTSFGRKVH